MKNMYIKCVLYISTNTLTWKYKVLNTVIVSSLLRSEKSYSAIIVSYIFKIMMEGKRLIALYHSLCVVIACHLESGV